MIEPGHVDSVLRVLQYCKTLEDHRTSSWKEGPCRVTACVDEVLQYAQNAVHMPVTWA